jgi:glutamate N-acetyltransferase/amino-acid N-acetyltransferase
MTALPNGFTCHVANIGIKDDTDDFVVITAERAVPAAGMFTRSRFVGPSVTISREHLESGTARAVVVVSKNANVANGVAGHQDALELVGDVARRLGCPDDDVLLASTGVIGRPYPMDRVRAGVAAMPVPADRHSADEAARGIMTTDTVRKVATAGVDGSEATIVGIAKGVGMIEPDMATMIAVVLTDADIAADELDRTFRRVVGRTLNCVSIDTDTSTSDTAIVMASGSAGAVGADAFEAALLEVCSSLTKQIDR